MRVTCIGLLLIAVMGATTARGNFADQAEFAEPENAVLAEESGSIPDNGEFLVEPAAGDCDCRCGCLACCNEIESAWYTRVEYFHWNERVDGADFVNEWGVLPTIGYFRRVNNRRLRLEFFGSQVHYDGEIQNSGGGNSPSNLQSHTNYIGGRTEFDFFFLPGTLRYFEMVGGVGLKIWDRDMPSVGSITGYHELWVNVYPYLGIETLKNPERRIQPFARARIGVTAFNYELVSLPPQYNLYPVANITGLCELGLRTERVFVSGYLESFAWKQSPEVNNFRQPDSTWFTTGIQVGLYR